MRGAPRFLRSAVVLALVLGLQLTPRAEAAERGPHHVIVEPAKSVPMRDGVKLIADIYRPAAEGRFPVLLQRTPYDRRNAETGVLLASHGYVVVLQDTRGRFGSPGEFYPFRHEARDGYDTVEWAAALPQSNGRVGMFGGSYVGATQMLAATERPPHLVAIQPYVTASEYYEGWTYQGGALMQWFATSWSTGLSMDTLQREARTLAKPRDWQAERPLSAYRLLRLPDVQGLARYLTDWIAHESLDDYWKATRVKDHYGKMAVKGLHSAGWHDIFSTGSIENFIGMRKGAATEEARRGQRLLVGPWGHAATSPEGKVGDVVFGKAAVLDHNALLLEWSDHVLKEQPATPRIKAPVRLFVMGENVWRDEQEFPLARARETRFFLRSGGAAHTAAGDGRLTEDAPGSDPADVFDYDPADPVQTLGGRLCCGDAYLPGPFDQRPNESRKDVLVYSTPPLERDLEVTGFISAELHAATSAVDTDFTAMLVDVEPSGYARYLADGVLRARYRKSTEKAELVLPGQIETYSISLGATSNVFKKGHRLRLYVSSSNFPRFSANPNTGEPQGAATRLVKARQTIYHDAAHPSALVLPVVPRP
jgi:uncharacterized protein